MRDFIDRVSSNPGTGTPLNREHMMAMQGFDNGETTFESNNSRITDTNGVGDILTTTISESNGIITITEVFMGTLTMTKTTTIEADGSITEVIS